MRADLASAEGDELISNTAVIAAYGAAREQGDSRCDAFVKAIRAYRIQYPELPANRAGAEVARILLAAAQAQTLSQRSGDLPGTGDMEYVEPA